MYILYFSFVIFGGNGTLYLSTCNIVVVNCADRRAYLDHPLVLSVRGPLEGHAKKNVSIGT